MHRKVLKAWTADIANEFGTRQDLLNAAAMVYLVAPDGMRAKAKRAYKRLLNEGVLEIDRPPAAAAELTADEMYLLGCWRMANAAMRANMRAVLEGNAVPEEKGGVAGGPSEVETTEQPDRRDAM